MSTINTADVYNAWKKELEDQIKELEQDYTALKNELYELDVKKKVLEAAFYKLSSEKAREEFRETELSPVKERINDLYQLISDAEENSELGRKRLILQTLTSTH